MRIFSDGGFEVTVEKTSMREGNAYIYHVLMMGIAVVELYRSYVKGGCAGRGGYMWFARFAEGSLEDELPVGIGRLWFRSSADTLDELRRSVVLGLRRTPIHDEHIGLSACILVGWVARQRLAANMADEGETMDEYEARMGLSGEDAA
jgi:hypothetical protein